MNLGRETENDKQNYVVCISASRHNRKITRKEMSNIFFQTYRYNMVKCLQNVNFENVDTERSAGKNDGF